MRPYVNKTDWIIAKLGKRFYTVDKNKRKYHVNFGKGYDLNKKKYLIYAMKITLDPKSNRNGIRILSSKEGDYFCFLDNPVEIPPKFYNLFPKGQAHKKIRFDEAGSEPANSFIKWIRKQKASNKMSLPKKFEKYSKGNECIQSKDKGCVQGIC
jgi:hypothetical protein